MAIKNRVRDELRPSATDQNEIGNDNNKMKKAINPKTKIGSPRK